MIHLKNATYIDWRSLDFIQTDIWVEEGSDRKIHFSDPGKKAKTVLDCNGMYLTKSFAVGHHHVYSALARGMGVPKKNPDNFYEILEYIWWTLDKCLSPEMIEYSALTTAMACAKAGSTFVIDHHASPNAIEGSLGIIADAFEKVGVSHLLCYEITDRDGQAKAKKGLAETRNYMKNHQGLIGLHASFTVGEKTLEKAVEMMYEFDSGIHVHVAEDKFDQTHSLQHYKKRVVQRFFEAGVLDSPKTILGHCLHLDKKERKMIGSTPCWVVQNMESNLNNRVGRFSAEGLGQRIMLGTDGMHSDMLQSAKAAFFAGQGFDTITYPGTYERFRNVHEYLNSNRFIGDGENNLVVLNYDSPTEFNSNNFYGHFLFGLSSNHVRHVISDGKLIVKDRCITTVDEERILKRSRELSKQLWKKMQG